MLNKLQSTNKCVNFRTIVLEQNGINKRGKRHSKASTLIPLMYVSGTFHLRFIYVSFTSHLRLIYVDGDWQ